jgi:hypothetical protein
MRVTGPGSSPYQGWSAILSGVATILMVITAILSSRLNLGRTFSVIVLVLMALIIIVALGLNFRLRSHAPTLSLVAVAIAVLAALVTGAAHVMQMAGALTPAQFNTLGEGTGPAGIGLWLLLANYLALRSGALPRGLSWLGLIAGAGYLMTGVGALIRGPASGVAPNALSSIGPLGIFFVYPAWAVWLGLWMLRQSKQVAADR